ncbi:MAG: hypothetical protein EOO15_11035 [Chitinophagaceae bacterium]|nr:MAG: hypothetical protein EOO15_11035 [Chitinophagaceae bacterium]
MPSAKHDKPFFAETDRLEQMPEGVRFRQAEVWASLESKLRHRRRRAAIVLRLSIAAALLLALALCWWMLPRTAESHPEVAVKQQPTDKVQAAVPLQVKGQHTLITTTTSRGPSTVEIRKASHPFNTGETPVVPENAPVIAQSSTWDVIDSPLTQEAVVAAPTSTPTRRFRIGHLNENSVQTPVVSDVAADDRSNYGLIHIPLTGVAGPNAGAVETIERKPRTLMSLFKPHQ